MRNLVNIIGSAASGGVSSLLAVETRGWEQIIFQQGKKPVDAEFNLLQQLIAEKQRLMLKGLFGSGLAGVLTPVIGTSANVAILSNGPALIPFLVDGRIVMAGDPANSNRITASLSAPQGSGSRSDLVFLEVWYAEVQPTGSPEAASSVIYTNGGVANATLSNDLIVIDAAESTRRIQMRWRMRVVDNVVPGTYPAGMTDPQVLGRGDAASPVAAKTFTLDSTDAGVWVAGAGTLSDGQAFKSVDGYVYATPLYFITRSVGVTTIPTSAYNWIGRIIRAVNADMVDGFHASSTPTAGMLLPLDATAKFPATVIPSTIDADTVDTFHASGTPVASKLLALDGSAKFPNSVLLTGTGNGLDADMVDGFHAAASPAASVLLALDGSSKYPNSVLKTGSGNGIDADTVDGFHAAASPAANTLVALDSFSQFPNSVLKTGAGNGIDADMVDGAHTTALAGSAAYAGKLLVLDSAGKLVNTALKTGAGQGIDADLLDGLHASGFAASVHTHAVAAGVAADTGSIGISCGNTYTVILTKAMTAAATGLHVISFSVYIASGTNPTTQWQATIFVDGVEATSIPILFDTARSPGIGWRSTGGLINLTVGARSISLRVKTTVSGQFVSVAWGRFNVIGPNIS